LNRLLIVCLFAVIISVTFVACAWQFDILSAPLVYQIKDEPFYYWWWSWSNWTHYAWTFWGMGISFFICVVCLILSSWRSANMKKLKFDLDPTPKRAAIICVCLFILTFVTGVNAVIMGGTMPTEMQFWGILCGSAAVAVAYVLEFLKFETKKEGD